MCILTCLYYISGLVIAACAIVALRQVSLLKRQLDFSKESRNKQIQREMIRCAAEQIQFFKADILDIVNKIELNSNGEEISFLSENNLVIKADGLAIKHGPSQEDFDKIGKYKLELTDLYNRLEVFASYFILKLADEELAFELIGEEYCSVLKSYLACYIWIEAGKPKRNAVFNLFLLWNSKRDALELIQKKRKIEKEISIKISNAGKNEIK